MRTVVATGMVQTETRHYLSSYQAIAASFYGYVQRHWGIETRLH